MLATLSAYGTPDEASEGTVAYTPNGQIDHVTDANANRTDYRYDRFDRLSRTTYSVAAAQANAVNPNDYEELTYDPAGRVLSRRTRRGELLQFAYDALDRMQSTTQDMDGAADGPSRTLTYGYDATGQLSQLTHPDGQYLRYINDRLGRTSEVWRAIANDVALRRIYPGGTAAPA